MISVALTTYNGQSYIKEQLDSIFQQTVPVDEVIICDDGSKDDTVSILKSYNNSKIHLIQNEQNLGYKLNFIKAMKHCHGDYVFLCDQDDKWAMNKVETMVHNLQEREDILVLASSFQYIDGQGNALNEKKNETMYPGEWQDNQLRMVSFSEFIRENYFQGASLLMKRRIVDEVVQTFQDYISHDWFINLTASKYDGFYFLNTPLFQYRIHEKNSLGVPVLNNSFFNWFKQANQKDKRLLGFQCSYLYLNQLKSQKDDYYLCHLKECDDLISLYKSCINMIENRKLFQTIKMLNNPHYKAIRRPKTRLMDLIYVVSHRF